MAEERERSGGKTDYVWGRHDKHRNMINSTQPHPGVPRRQRTVALYRHPLIQPRALPARHDDLLDRFTRALGRLLRRQLISDPDDRAAVSTSFLQQFDRTLPSVRSSISFSFSSLSSAGILGDP